MEFFRSALVLVTIMYIIAPVCLILIYKKYKKETVGWSLLQYFIGLLVFIPFFVLFLFLQETIPLVVVIISSIFFLIFCYKKATKKFIILGLAVGFFAAVSISFGIGCDWGGRNPNPKIECVIYKWSPFGWAYALIEGISDEL